MRERFLRFLKEEGVLSRFLEAYERDFETREHWHRDREYDFWDKKNQRRFLSGAFDWADENSRRLPENRISWVKTSDKWLKMCSQSEMEGIKLNSNTRTL